MSMKRGRRQGFPRMALIARCFATKDGEVGAGSRTSKWKFAGLTGTRCLRAFRAWRAGETYIVEGFQAKDEV